ncbi:MAG TPA: Wzz/FepE/Etk N-terminal domain-containing protein [Amycolatopsis sp.]|nr:Wzz/FepE/Etk N-terminal domain-containing protein [Amycolatopsis sp.]
MTTTESAQPLLDLQRVFMAIRRRRRLWLSTAVIGLIAGALLAFLVPTPPSAATTLLVLHEEDQPNDAGTLIKTDVAVLQTTLIADAALKAIHSTEPPEKFVKDYTGTGLTNNVMRIDVKGTSYADATAKAQALADAFITDHRQRMQTTADAEAQALLTQRNELQTQLDQVNNQITAAGGRNNQVGPAELQSLYAQRADLTSRIGDFTNQASQAKIGTPQLAAGTQIVDAPRPVKSSMLSSAATSGGIGLGFGLVLGLVAAAVMSVVRDRPVFRRDISANLGASVIAQLPGQRRGPLRFWMRSRTEDEERKRIASTLARAVTGDPGTVSVLEIGCPGVAAALALAVAEELTIDGPVVVIDDLPDREVTAVAQPDDKSVQVIDGSDRVPAQADRVVGVGSVSPGTAWTDLDRLGAETVLLVRAGKASTLWLHTVARQLADLKIPIIGVVLVAPDPRDHTDGTLWDGLHTALRGRGALPRPSSVDRDRTKKFAPVVNSDDDKTKKFAPVANGNGTPPNDLPTRRFAPVGRQDGS